MNKLFLVLVLLGSISTLFSQSFTVECETDSTLICYDIDLECKCKTDYSVKHNGIIYQGVLDVNSTQICFRIPGNINEPGWLFANAFHTPCGGVCKIPEKDSVFWYACKKELCGNYYEYAGSNPAGYKKTLTYNVQSKVMIFDANADIIVDTLIFITGNDTLGVIPFGKNNDPNGEVYGPFTWINGNTTKYTVLDFPCFDSVGVNISPAEGFGRFYVVLPDTVCILNVVFISSSKSFTSWRIFQHCTDSIPRIISDTIFYNTCKPIVVENEIISSDTTILSYWVNSVGCDVTRYHIVNYEPISDIFSDSTICYPSFIGGEYVDNSMVVPIQRDSLGCQFTEFIQVTYAPPSSDLVLQQVCSGDSVQGVQVFSDTLITEFIENVDGCVDTIQYSVFVEQVQHEYSDTIVCSGEMVDEVVVYNDTILVSKAQTQLGCSYDIVKNVQVEIVQNIVNDTLVCIGTTVANHAVFSDTTIVIPYTTSLGCPYFEKITVSVENPSDIILDTTLCFEGVVYGQLYTSSAITTILRYTSLGCPYEETVKVTVEKPADMYFDTLLCRPSLVYGVYVTQDTLFSTTEITVEGCAFSNHYEVNFVDPPVETIFHDICTLPWYIDGVSITGDTLFVHQHYDHDGCIVLYEYVVNLIEKPELTFTSPDLYCSFSNVLVSVLNPNLEMISGTIGDQSFSIKDYGNELLLGKSNLALGHNQIEIKYSKESCIYFEEVQFRIENCDVYFPNAISPDGNGINDVFYPQSKLGEVSRISLLTIYDRWGNQIFYSKDFPSNEPQYGWSGRYKGEIMDSGVYVWSAEVIFADGTSKWLKGEVTISK